MMNSTLLDARTADQLSRARKAPAGVEDFERFKVHANAAAQKDEHAKCISFHRGKANTNGRSVWLGTDGKRFSIAVS
jgi:hypothetical protein